MLSENKKSKIALREPLQGAVCRRAGSAEAMLSDAGCHPAMVITVRGPLAQSPP
jgi:hypothetical protein